MLILEDLYLGDVRPSERSFKRNSQYAKALDELVKAGDTRFDAAEVAAEVEYARELEKQMAKEAREKMREERSEAFKETVSKKSEELKN